MKATLVRWIGDADALRYAQVFDTQQISPLLEQFEERSEDYYISLVGELFDRMREEYDNSVDWARMGNAIGQFATRDPAILRELGINATEAKLYAATAFYAGGYPASAYLTMRNVQPESDQETLLACYDFLQRPHTLRSETVPRVLELLREGDLEILELIRSEVAQRVDASLASGPSEWIPERLLQVLLNHFSESNIRSVLPEESTEFWSPLVTSYIDQTPPLWEFFPSQIEAINEGLLTSDTTYTIQMPTGAGKTTLCETLFYRHLRSDVENTAVLLVPYRSLASELRGTLVKRLRGLGIRSSALYGGTVPDGNEAASLDEIRALVATPESLSGLLSANPEFFNRITLAVCDEGHLLDSGTRGVSLELLLARLKARLPTPPRFVFMSAIVPNVEEINAWLGGSNESVLRSSYRPAIAEFSLLRVAGNGVSSTVALEMHPHASENEQYDIEAFLDQRQFQYLNVETGRFNTYPFTSIKTQAIAAARMTLKLGGTAIFAANKSGSQGAIGLAEELLKQLAYPLLLPTPKEHCEEQRVALAQEYLSEEYGADWIGTRMVSQGAVLHHGDIPQETREVLERLIRSNHCKLVICTNTLAEGVNLPIRTLVLYSVTRRDKDGAQTHLLARDIKNLVGRAGRAGTNTKGLVICANANQWKIIEPVAHQAIGEPVTGALRTLILNIQQHLATTEDALSNEFLESNIDLYALIDGVDATLIELAAQEIGEEELFELAERIAEQTFADLQSEPDSSDLLKQVFRCRTERVLALKATGQLSWIRETGARPRMVEEVQLELYPMFFESWENLDDPVDPEFVRVLIDWAFSLGEFIYPVRNAFAVDEDILTANLKFPFETLVTGWLAGRSFRELSLDLGLEMNDLLRIYSGLLTFTFQTLVEQGLSILAKLLESQGQELSIHAMAFSECLRFGVSSTISRILMSKGVRHRRAAARLGEALDPGIDEPLNILLAADDALRTHKDEWIADLGGLIYENTLTDLRSALSQ